MKTKQRVIAVTTYLKVPEPPEGNAPIKEQALYDATTKFDDQIVKTLVKVSHDAVQSALADHLPTANLNTVSNVGYLCTSDAVSPSVIFYPLEEVNPSEE